MRLSARMMSALLIAVLALATHSGLLAQDDPAADVMGEGQLVADLGFRADGDGFGFENYGNDGVTNMTSAEMVRLFGEQVCLNTPDAEGFCNLNPLAEQWMDEINGAMDGGHCEGMATLSTLFFIEAVELGLFDEVDFTSELELEDNEFLQREIAYWWAYQALSPTLDNELFGPPSAVVQQLIDTMNDGSEIYTIGIYMPGYEGGHAITPYAVVDMGGGVYRILVYDNNYPFEERFIEVDSNAETWVYTGSTNPNEPESEYAGDAETLTLTISPMSARFEEQVCPFCQEAVNADGKEYTSVSFNGRGIVEVELRGRRVRASGTALRGNFLDPSVQSQQGIGTGNAPGGVMFIAGVGPDGEIVAALPRNLGAADREATLFIEVGVEFKIFITPDPDNPDNPITSVSFTQSGNVTSLDGLDISQNPQIGVDGETFSYSADGETTIIFESAYSNEDGSFGSVVLEGPIDEFGLSINEDGTLNFDGGENGNSLLYTQEIIDAEGNVTVIETQIDIPAGASVDFDPATGEFVDGATGEPLQSVEPQPADEQPGGEGGGTEGGGTEGGGAEGGGTEGGGTEGGGTEGGGAEGDGG